MKRVVVAINYVSFEDRQKSKRQEVALDVLCTHVARNDGAIKVVSFNYPEDNVELPDWCGIRRSLSRNSKDVIGNNRPLPYIKDLFDGCMEFDCDYFGYINSDILLHSEFFGLFETDKDAYVFYRREIADVGCEAFMDQEFNYVWGGDEHPGNDAFFFRKSWWEQHRDEYPDDLVVGETEWDTVYRVVTQNVSKNYLESRELCHVYHDAKWTLETPGAINNIKIWNETKEKYGVK